eukprot:m.84932 g.84932  ORF g.84932 m.84932 type:complete len:1368 (+) comp14410_c0_seq1:151-4254(+)
MDEGIPASLLVDMVVQRSYRELTDMTETFANARQRQRDLMRYLHETRQRFLRLIVILRWLSKGSQAANVAALVSEVSMKHMTVLETANALHGHVESMALATLPTYDIPHAVDVLASGEYPRLPRNIEMLLPEPPLLKSSIDRALTWLHMQMRGRLADEPMPKGLTYVSIGKGRLTLGCTGLYELGLTIKNHTASSPWRLLSLDVMVTDAWQLEASSAPPSYERLVSVRHVEHLHHILSRLLEKSADKPLSRCCAAIHTFCLSLQLNILRNQAESLRKTSWKKDVTIVDFTPATSVKIAFWPQFSLMGTADVDQLSERKSWQELTQSSQQQAIQQGRNQQRQAFSSTNAQMEAPSLRFCVVSPLIATSEQPEQFTVYDSLEYYVDVTASPPLPVEAETKFVVGRRPDINELLLLMQRALAEEALTELYDHLVSQSDWPMGIQLRIAEVASSDGVTDSGAKRKSLPVELHITFPLRILTQSTHIFSSTVAKSRLETDMNIHPECETIVVRICKSTGRFLLHAEKTQCDLKDVERILNSSTPTQAAAFACFTTAIRNCILASITKGITTAAATSPVKSASLLGLGQVMAPDAIEFSRCFAMLDYPGFVLMVGVTLSFGVEMQMLLTHLETAQEVVKTFPYEKNGKANGGQAEVSTPLVFTVRSTPTSLVAAALSAAALYQTHAREGQWETVCKSAFVQGPLRVDGLIMLEFNAHHGNLPPIIRPWLQLSDNRLRHLFRVARFCMMLASISKQLQNEGVRHAPLFPADYVKLDALLSNGISLRLYNLPTAEKIRVTEALLFCSPTGLCRWHVSLEPSTLPKWLMSMPVHEHENGDVPHGRFDWMAGSFTATCLSPSRCVIALREPWFAHMKLLGLACQLKEHEGRAVSMLSFGLKGLEIGVHQASPQQHMLDSATSVLGTTSIRAPSTTSFNSAPGPLLMVFRVVWQQDKSAFDVSHFSPRFPLNQEQTQVLESICRNLKARLNQSYAAVTVLSNFVALQEIITILLRGPALGFTMTMRSFTRIILCYFKQFYVEFKFCKKNTVMMRDLRPLVPTEQANTPGGQHTVIPYLAKFVNHLQGILALQGQGRAVINDGVVVVDAAARRYVLPLEEDGEPDRFTHFLGLQNISIGLQKACDALPEATIVQESTPTNDMYLSITLPGKKLELSFRDWQEFELQWSFEPGPLAFTEEILKVVADLLNKKITQPPYDKAGAVYFLRLLVLPLMQITDILSVSNCTEAGMSAVVQVPHGFQLLNANPGDPALVLERSTNKDSSVVGFSIFFTILHEGALHAVPLRFDMVEKDIYAWSLADVEQCPPSFVQQYSKVEEYVRAAALGLRRAELPLFSFFEQLVANRHVLAIFPPLLPPSLQ